MNPQRISIRKAVLADAAGMAHLEATAGDVRWSHAQILDELTKPVSRYWVASVPDVGEDIVGYVGGWLIPPELQVSNIVIHPAHRCRGIGRQLLEHLLSEASAEGCRHATLEVRSANQHAQSLYRRVGFQETGRRARFYRDPEDDAVLMQKESL